MAPAIIQLATRDDLPAINDIYNHSVLHSTATYQEEPETMDGRVTWFERHGEAHPVTVAEISGEVVGWASISAYHPRSAYRFTVENSVYIRHDQQRRGIGRALMFDMIERARRIGHHTIIAGIDASMSGSIALHRGLGFVPVGHLREVGFKFERWLDVVYMQLLIRDS